MTSTVRTWDDVVAQRKLLAMKLVEPLTEQDKRTFEYLVTKERDQLYLKEPRIIQGLLEYLEEHSE